MSERITHTLRFKDMEITETKTRTTAQSLEERWAGLIAASREQLGGPILEQYLAVCCDGCGTVVAVDQSLPSGWSTTDRGEFCPNCS
jgi:hypothetical protein